MDTIIALVFLGLIWWLFFFLWRDYRLDRFRQNLFALRGELFDFACEGNIPFDHPAYGMLRSTINGTIRYGHRFGLCEIVLFGFVGKTPAGEAVTKRYDEKWKKVLNELDEPTREKLRVFRHRLHLEIAEQVLFTSFVLVFTTVAILLFVLLRWMGARIGQAVHRTINRVVNSKAVSGIVDGMDATAYLATHVR